MFWISYQWTEVLDRWTSLGSASIKEVSVNKGTNQEEEMTACTKDKALCHLGDGRSEGDDGSYTMKLPSVTDYQGSAFHYLPFITRYLWQLEVLESHNTHASYLLQRFSVCARACMCVREKERDKWCRKNVNCVGKWLLQYAILLSISQLYEFADGIVGGCFELGQVQVVQCSFY